MRARQEGMSIVELLVAVGILAIVSGIIVKAVKFGSDSSNITAFEASLDEIRNVVRLQTDCTATVAAIAGCTTPVVAVKMRTGTDVIQKYTGSTTIYNGTGATIISPFPVYAYCTSAKSFNVAYWSKNCDAYNAKASAWCQPLFIIDQMCP